MFIHLWRMPLFFILAGFFAAMVIAKRGHMTFATDRALRIGGTLAFFALAFNITLDRPLGSLDHLWFLWLLLLYCACIVLWHSLRLPRLWRLDGDQAHWLIPMCIVLAAFLRDDQIWHRIPEVPWDPEWRGFLMYGAFFAMGTALWAGRECLDILRRPIAFVPWLTLGLIGATGTVALMDSDDIWLRAAASGLGTAGISLGLIGLCLAAVRRTTPLVAWLSEGAYAIYLLHLYPTIALSVFLINEGYSQVAVVGLASLGGFACAVVLWYLLIRWTPLDILLSGPEKARASWPIMAHHPAKSATQAPT